MLRAISSLPTSGRNDAKGCFAKNNDERNLKLTAPNFPSSPKGDKRGAFGIIGGLLLSHHLLAANDDESAGILAHWLAHDVVCFLVILVGMDVIYSSSGGL